MAGKSKYYDIKEQLEAKILQGEYPVGSQLPSEPDLADMFNASRGTIRKTLAALARDAVVARRSGAGTFIIREPRGAQVKSFTTQLKEAGMVPVTKVLAKEQIMASEAQGRVLEAYNLNEEKAKQTPVYRIDRLRCGNDQAIARQTIYLLVEQFRSNLLEVEDFSQSIIDMYHRYYRQVSWADEIIHARLATPEEIELFGMQDFPLEKQLVYVRERISYDETNVVLEVMTSVDRADSFRTYQYRILEDRQTLQLNK